jgi:hypothetical protein
MLSSDFSYPADHTTRFLAAGTVLATMGCRDADRTRMTMAGMAMIFRGQRALCAPASIACGP